MGFNLKSEEVDHDMSQFILEATVQLTKTHAWVRTFPIEEDEAGIAYVLRANLASFVKSQNPVKPE